MTASETNRSRSRHPIKFSPLAAQDSSRGKISSGLVTFTSIVGSLHPATKQKGHTMRLMTIAQYQQLIENGASEDSSIEHIPVIKITIPGNAFTWLISAIDPEDQNIAYGLYKEFDKFSIYGSVDLEELLVFRTADGLGIELDKTFKGYAPLSAYKAAEWWYGHLIEDEETLQKFGKEYQTAQLQLI